MPGKKQTAMVCKTCDAKLYSDSDIRKHVKETGHKDYGGYDYQTKDSHEDK